MINMKQKHEKSKCETMESERPEYPYGLRIELNDESLKKLGITELPDVGDVMSVHARVEVVSVSQYDSTDGVDRNLSLQITDMEIGGDNQSAEKVLYPDME